MNCMPSLCMYTENFLQNILIEYENVLFTAGKLFLDVFLNWAQKLIFMDTHQPRLFVKFWQLGPNFWAESF